MARRGCYCPSHSMTAGNDPAAWQNFYIMIGTANAAITGLLFVALSLHLRDILSHPLFKPRAIVVLVVLTLQIIISAIVLAPQPRVLMGVEILVLNVGFIACARSGRSAPGWS